MSAIKKCIVPGCNTQPSRLDARWYKFPGHNSLVAVVDKGKTVYFSRQRVWLNKLGLHESCLDKNSVICSLHFDEKDILSSEIGSPVLKDHIIPTRNIPNIPNTEGPIIDIVMKQETESHVNEIETEEKSDDDDDDIEIIEPTREIITLDDDDDDESRRESTEEDTSMEIGEKDKNEAKIVTEPLKNNVEGSLQSNLSKAKTLHSALTEKTASPLTKQTGVPNVTPVPTVEKKENGYKTAAIVTSEGKKLTVQIAPNGKILPIYKSISNPTDPPNNNVPDPEKELGVFTVSKGDLGATKDSEKQNYPQVAPKIGENYVMQVFASKHGKALEDTDVSEAAKKQLSDLIKRTPILKTALDGDASKGEKSAVKVNVAPKAKKKKGGVAKKVKTRERASSNPETDTSATLNESSDGSGSQDKTHSITLIPKPTKRMELLKKSVENPDEFRYVSVEQLLRKGLDNDKKPPLEVIPFGFSDIYDFINNYILNFTFDVFGTKYVLKECGLHFETKNAKKEKYEKKTAIISNSSLSSSDAFLLNGMNVSLGITNEIFDSTMFRKVVRHKREWIKRSEVPKSIPDVPSLHESENETNQIPDEPEGEEEISKVRKVYLEKRINTPDRPKIVVHPDKFVLVEDRLVEPVAESSRKRCIVNDFDNNRVPVHENKQRIVINSKSPVNMLNLQEESMDSGNKRIVIHPDTPILTNNKSNPLEKVVFNQNERNVVISKTSVLRENDLLIPVEPSDKDPLGMYEGTSVQSGPTKTAGVVDRLKSPDKDELYKDRRKVIKKKMKGKFTTMARRMFDTPMSQMNPTLQGRLLVGSSKFKINRRLMQKKEENKSNNDVTGLEAGEISPMKQSEAGSPTDEKSSKYKRRKVKKDYKSFSYHGTTEDMTMAKLKWKKFKANQPPKKMKYSDKVGHIESFLEVVLEPENKDETEMETSTSDVTNDDLF